MNHTILEDRLINFSVLIIDFSKSIPDSYAGFHLSKQLIRSGTSVSLNYGEVRGAESKKDFVHKMRIVLKELRESNNCLKIIQRAVMDEKSHLLEELLNENNQLISIFVSSLKTAQSSI
jgi:four helix bundle protein